MKKNWRVINSNKLIDDGNNIFINKDKDVKRVNNNMTVYKDNILKKIMGIIKEIFEKQIIKKVDRKYKIE